MSAMPSNTVPADVSRRALSIARMIDRLGPGNYTIHLRRPDNTSERWTIEIQQPVTIVHKRDVVDKAHEENRNA